MADEISIISISTDKINPKDKHDKRCAPNITFESGSCIKLSVLIEMAKAYNIDAGESKIKLYIPEWKKCVSVAYKKIDDTIWSMDEQRELNLDEIEINCTFNLNARNWKEKVIINIV